MRLHFAEMARQAEKEFARRLRESNTGRLFGFELEAAEAGRAVVKMTVRARHRQMHGVVHGGVLAALADTAGGIACYMAVPRGTRVATIEMKINYLEPVKKGSLMAEARMLRLGRRTGVVQCDVRDHDARLVATSLQTYSIGG